MYSFVGVNSALRVLLEDLRKYGIKREMNGAQKATASYCIEFPYPIMIEIKNPECRNVLIPARKWRNILPVAESLWILLGWDNLNDLTGRYAKSLYNFSDDGVRWRGAYGSRIRGFTGVLTPYKRGLNEDERREGGVQVSSVDQLLYCVEYLKKEPTTRQALITIHDPAKDSILGMKTKDIPCTRSIHFMVTNGKLDCIVWMRSNDLIRGFSAVNLYNFTFMQKYVSMLTGIPVGRYYHVANNLHIYEDSMQMVDDIIATPLKECEDYDKEQIGSDNFYHLANPEYKEFLDNAKTLYGITDELYLMNQKDNVSFEDVCKIKEKIDNSFEDQFWREWACAFMFYGKNLKPHVQKLFSSQNTISTGNILHNFIKNI